MKNPWLELNFKKEPPYILECDKEVIYSFNSSKSKNGNYYIQTDMVPEPYIGNPINCKVLLLSLNPGFTQCGFYFHLYNHYFREISVKNLLFESLGYPFYLLDPEIRESPGSIWWRRILSQPLKEKGDKKIANTFAVIEFFPYPSRKYKDICTILESQRYNFKLVRNCLKRETNIILMRGFKKWFNEVPDLKNYEKLIYCRNVQNPRISLGNLSKYSKKEERIKIFEDSKFIYKKLLEIIT